MISDEFGLIRGERTTRTETLCSTWITPFLLTRMARHVLAIPDRRISIVGKSMIRRSVLALAIDEEVPSHLNERKPEMRGLTVSDKNARNVLTFDLKDILLLLGEKALNSTWSVKGLEVVDGEAARELHALSDTEQVVSGERLQELAASISQTVDGEFVGSLGESVEPWILIRAVDSSAFDIITADRDVYRKIKARFADVVELFNVDAF